MKRYVVGEKEDLHIQQRVFNAREKFLMVGKNQSAKCIHMVSTNLDENCYII